MMNIRILILACVMLMAAVALRAQPADILWGKPGGLSRHVIAFSPDGSELAYGYDGGVRFADAVDGALLGAVPLNGVAAIAYSPSGAFVACAGKFGPVLLIDARTREVLQTIPSGVEHPRIAFLSDSLLLFSASGPLELWSIPDRTVIHSFGEFGVFGLAVAPDRSRFAWQGVQGITVAGSSGDIITTLHGLFPLGFTFSADGSGLVVVDSAGTSFEVQVRELPGGAITQRFPVAPLHPLDAGLPLHPITISPDGRLVTVTLGTDSSAWFWKLASGEREHILYFNTKVAALEFSPDGRYLAVGGNGLQAHQLDARSWDYIRDLDLGHTGRSFAVAYSPDNHWVATAGEDRRVRLWDARNGIPGRMLLGAESTISDLAFSPDGASVAAVEYGGEKKSSSVVIWDLATGEIVRRFPIEPPPSEFLFDNGPVLAFSSDGESILTGSANASLRRWNVESGELAGVFGDSSERIYAIALSGDGALVAAVTGASQIMIWNMERGELLTTIRYVTVPWSVAFGRDERSLVVGDAHGGIWSIDIPSEKSLYLGVHEGGAVDVAVSRDGRRIFSAGGDGVVQVHDAANGAPLHRYTSQIPYAPKGRGGRAWCGIALAGDGSGAATVALDGTVAAWRAEGVIAGAGEGHPVLAAALRVWPNPSAGGVVDIGVGLPSSGEADLRVYNLLGEEVSVIAISRFEQGAHTFQWSTSELPPGGYFIRLKTEQGACTERMVVGDPR